MNYLPPTFIIQTLAICSAHGRLAAMASYFTVTYGATRQINIPSRTSCERKTKRMIRLRKRSDTFSIAAMS